MLADIVEEPGTTPMVSVEESSQHFFAAQRAFNEKPLSPYGRFQQVLFLNSIGTDDNALVECGSLIYILAKFGEYDAALIKANVASEEQRAELSVRRWHREHESRSDVRARVTMFLASLSKKQQRQCMELAAEILDEEQKSRLREESQQPTGGNEPGK